MSDFSPWRSLWFTLPLPRTTPVPHAGQRCFQVFYQLNVQDKQLSVVLRSPIPPNDTNLYCCRIHRYIAQHMNIHNPEDFALFRVTERKGLNPATISFLIPQFSRLHLSWGHVPAQNTGRIEIDFLSESTRSTKFLGSFQEGGKGLSLVYRRIDSNVLLPLPSPLPLW